jgi:hypothetical protein
MVLVVRAKLESTKMKVVLQTVKNVLPASNRPKLLVHHAMQVNILMVGVANHALVEHIPLQAHQVGKRVQRERGQSLTWQ